MIKPVRDIDVNEYCPRCDEPAERQFVPSRVHISGASVQHAEFNPGLGCVVKDKYHRSEICKRKGLVEIGNDYKSPDRIHKEMDTVRAERREKRWEEA